MLEQKNAFLKLKLLELLRKNVKKKFITDFYILTQYGTNGLTLVTALTGYRLSTHNVQKLVYLLLCCLADLGCLQGK